MEGAGRRIGGGGGEGKGRRALDDVGVAEASGDMEGGQPALVHFIYVAASAALCYC